MCCLELEATHNYSRVMEPKDYSSAITIPEGHFTTSYSCVFKNEHYCSFSSRRHDSLTVMGLPDSSGNVVQKMYYSAWGQPGYETSGGNLAKGSVFDFGYTGMFVEPYTGMLHTHFRDYDWKTHRWDREDPAGYQDGLNLYGAYFDVNGVDPDGLSADGLSTNALTEMEKQVIHSRVVQEFLKTYGTVDNLEGMINASVNSEIKIIEQGSNSSRILLKGSDGLKGIVERNGVKLIKSPIEMMDDILWKELKTSQEILSKNKLYPVVKKVESFISNVAQKSIIVENAAVKGALAIGTDKLVKASAIRLSIKIGIRVVPIVGTLYTIGDTVYFIYEISMEDAYDTSPGARWRMKEFYVMRHKHG